MPFSKRYLSATILLLGVFVFCQAQIWLENEPIYNEAMGYLDGAEYEEAIPLFQLLEKKGQKNAHVSYQLGVCYLNVKGKKTLAIAPLEEAVLQSSAMYVPEFTEQRAPLDAYLMLGIAYKVANRFPEAISAFNTYSDSVATEAAEQLAAFHINQVENARLFQQNAAGYKLETIKDNSNYSLTAPVVVSDSLLFYMEARPFYDAIVSGAIKSNVLIERENLTPQIGSSDELTLLSVAENGDVLLLRDYVFGKGYELFYAEKEDGKYSEFKAFPEPINSPSNEMFASLYDKTLYFSSNRPGGEGGTDIYRSEKGEDGQWSAPENLGVIINSPRNENLCFVSSDGDVLLLNSQGHVNMGGFDLFYSEKKDDGKWSAPINFGSPLSTTDDDEFLSVSKDNYLYTSARVGDNRSDELVKVLFDQSNVSRKTVVNFDLEFTDEVVAKEVQVVIREKENNEEVSRFNTNADGSGKTLLGKGNYEIAYVHSENIDAHQSVNIDDGMSVDEIYLLSPQWRMHETTVAAEETKTQIVYTVNNILFGFNSESVSNDYFNMLDTIAKGMLTEKDVKVVLVGHADALGNSEYNKKLAYRRALAVAKYLLNEGVADEQVEVLSKGEEKPVAINKNTDGTDNPQGRSYNRRVELFIEADSAKIVVNKVEDVPVELRID